MSDILSKEQLLLLQQTLTYEVYEQFMEMFNNEDEILPIDIEDRNKYILDTMKNHEYWGRIVGWGDNRVYCHLPKRNSFVVEDTGPHGVYSMFKGKSKKELLKFLDEFKKYTPDTFTPNKCIPVDIEKPQEDYESTEIQQHDISYDSWLED
tara:strand:+ start:781 stop:1233 length:453 start_codon:yes stop_codon:yes gene_type:complete